MSKPPIYGPRHPSKTPATTLDAFVSGDQTPERPVVQTTTRVVRKRTGARLRRIGVYLPEALYGRFAVYCVRRDTTMSEEISRLIDQAIGRLGD